MNSEHANFPRENIIGVGQKSDQEIFSSVLKHWRKRLGFCTIAAAVPALLASNLPTTTRSEGIEKPKRIIPRPAATILEKLNLTASKRSLLKRQSGFRLPHQRGATFLSALAAGDDCPGLAIPGGSYSSGTPFVDSGDTTGANDTVTAVPSYYYYSY